MSVPVGVLVAAVVAFVGIVVAIPTVAQRIGTKTSAILLLLAWAVGCVLILDGLHWPSAWQPYAITAVSFGIPTAWLVFGIRPKAPDWRQPDPSVGTINYAALDALAERRREGEKLFRQQITATDEIFWVADYMEWMGATRRQLARYSKAAAKHFGECPPKVLRGGPYWWALNDRHNEHLTRFAARLEVLDQVLRED
jgi:hypothetical protein